MGGGLAGTALTAMLCDDRLFARHAVGAESSRAGLAGGDVRGGTKYGTTDELGFEAVEGKVHLHDLHATILHLLGVNHEMLTFFHSGRNDRLTDVAGRVVQEIIRGGDVCVPCPW